MRKSVVIAAALVAVFSISSASADMESDFRDIASECRKSGGLTAISRLPGVRIVVYDPMTNSFGFASCNSTEKEVAIDNLDHMDRRRLALPTQKIRLIVLPYNQLDGELFLTAERAAGDPEIAEFSLGGVAPKAAADKQAAPSDKAAPDEKKEVAPVTAPQAITVSQTVQDLFVISGQSIERIMPSAKNEITFEGLQQRIGGYETFRLRPIAPKEPQKWERLLFLADRALRDLEVRSQTISGEIRGWNDYAACVGDAIDRSALGISERLRGESFDLSRDVTLAEVAREAKRRIEATRKELYSSTCGEPKNPLSFEEDAANLRSAFDNLREDRRGLALLLGFIAETLGDLQKEDLPEDFKLADWNQKLKAITKALDDGKAFTKGFDEALTSAAKEMGALREGHLDLLDAVVSPALASERFNFPPLKKGEVLTFRVSRDGKPEKGNLRPADSNEIELRHVPAYTARFSSGLVFSDLDDPEFRVDGEGFLRLSDEGNGEVRPVLFVHHFWGWRSPALRPTPFEKFMPTFSLGLPLTTDNKALFNELLLGLDWELATGIDLNVGVHFGLVNALRDKSLLNSKPTVAGDKTLELADFQKKTTDKALYFGITVNTEIFKLFQNGGNSN